MRKLFAFLVWLFSLWTWKDLFLRWFWSPASPPVSGEPVEDLPSQEGQHESELACFLSSLPEDGRRCQGLIFDGDSTMTIYFERFQFTLHHGNDGIGIEAGYHEFFEAVASSEITFREGVGICLCGDDSCKHVEAFADALCQCGNGIKKLHLASMNGSAIRFAKCVSSVLLKNNAIEDLHLDIVRLNEDMGKEVAVEFMSIMAMPNNLQILKSFNMNARKLDGKGMEQLLKPFHGPPNVLDKLMFYSLTSDAQLEQICTMLASSTSLKTLSLYRDSQSANPKAFTNGFNCIATALCSNKSLEALSCNISNSMELKVLLDPLMPNNHNLQRNTTLTKLSLSESIGGKEGIETIVDLIHTNTSLRELGFIKVDDFSLQDIQGIENVLAVLEALKTNKSLKKVDFPGCSAVGGYKVLGAMMDLLLENHNIEDMDLASTGLSKSRDADYVYSALSKKKKMKLWGIVQSMAIANPTSGHVFFCGEPFADKLFVLMFYG